MAVPARLTLVTREGCGLCRELADELSRLGVPFTTLDVDGDPALASLYSECVPVLLNDDEELARAPFTGRSLKQALRFAGVLP
jgi:hypothetical protein